MAREKPVRDFRSFEEMLEYREIDESISEKVDVPGEIVEPGTYEQEYEEPSGLMEPEPEHKAKPALLRRLAKPLLIISILLIIYFFLMDHIEALLRLNPPLWAAYEHITFEIGETTLLGFFYVAFFGSLFFIALPIEAFFIYYLTLDYSLAMLIFMGVVATVMGNIINYYFGRLLGERAMRWMFKKKYEKYKQMLERVGPIILVGGNVAPLPMEIVSIIYGAMKYPVARFTLFVFLGKLLKFIVIYFGYNYFIKVVVPWTEKYISPYFSPIASFFRWLVGLFS